MKIIRKGLVFFCVFALMLSFFCSTASAMIFSDGDFGFELNVFQKVANLVEYTGNGGTVTVPSGYSTYKLTQVNKSAFHGKTKVEIVNLPTTVTTLESEAFADCSALKTFTVSENITSYGDSLLQNCTALTSAYVYSGLTKLPNNTFRYCGNLSYVKLGSKISAVGNNAFFDCVSFKDASILSQISSIGEYAFYNTGLETVTLSDSLQEVPDFAFASCSDLTRVNIPFSVTSISDSAFADDPQLILGVYYQSYAYNYAKDRNIPYVLLDGVLLGDVNGDDSIDIGDATTIQRYLAELEKLDGLYLLAADANCDGTVDISDATAIQMFLAEYDIPYPIGQLLNV